MYTFRASARPYPPAPSKKPGAAGGSGRTQAWEGHARETHCRRPPSHAQPDAYLGRTRPPPPAPHQCPLPAKSSPPCLPSPRSPSSQSPAGRARSPTSSLAARRSLPPPLRPPEPRTRSLARGFSGAHAYANIRAHLYERGGGWGGGGGGWHGRSLHAPVRASAAMLRAFPPPGARWAPLLPRQSLGYPPPLTPACALRLQGARAGRPPTARARVHLVAVPCAVSGLGVRRQGLLAELALRGPSVSRAPSSPAAPAPPHLTLSIPGEQRLREQRGSWQPTAGLDNCSTKHGAPPVTRPRCTLWA